MSHNPHIRHHMLKTICKATLTLLSLLRSKKWIWLAVLGKGYRGEQRDIGFLFYQFFFQNTHSVEVYWVVHPILRMMHCFHVKTAPKLLYCQRSDSLEYTSELEHLITTKLVKFKLIFLTNCFAFLKENSFLANTRTFYGTKRKSQKNLDNWTPTLHTIW